MSVLVILGRKCTPVNHVEYAPTGQPDSRTDGRTPDRYIMLSATSGQRRKRHAAHTATEQLLRLHVCTLEILLLTYLFTYILTVCLFGDCSNFAAVTSLGQNSLNKSLTNMTSNTISCWPVAAICLIVGDVRKNICFHLFC